jgi:F420H(2)-dependent quinone reductase
VSFDAAYEPSAFDVVADQVRLFEDTDGAAGNELGGKPVVILHTIGRKTGKVRKTPLMRVKDGETYLVVASLGGAPKHPVWYLNLLEHPDVRLQDGATVYELRARTASPEEKARLWPIATAAWPDYDQYQASTDRDIPVVVLEPR